MIVKIKQKKIKALNLEQNKIANYNESLLTHQPIDEHVHGLSLNQISTPIYTINTKIILKYINNNLNLYKIRIRNLKQ